MEENQRQIPIVQLLLFICILLGIMMYSMFVLQVEPHFPLLISLLVLLVIGMKNNFSWTELEDGMVNGIKIAIKPLLILAIVGMLIAVWMMSGTIPTIIYYGLHVISPQWFALSALFICIIVSTFTGSSFTTIGTIGIAMFGIGTALGINPALVAGAVISGACFGDKMSPLSDTTNFASGIAGVDIFEHIKHLCWTMVPALIISMLFFGFRGTQVEPGSLANISELISSLDQHFVISIWTLLSPAFVVLFAIRRKPTLLALLVGLITGLLIAIVIQGVYEPKVWLETLQHGFDAPIVNETIATIVIRGGLQSMMWAISLIMIALAFGGVVQKLGVLETLIHSAMKRLKRTGDIIATTATTSIAVNTLTGEQYLSILIPGKMFPKLYEKHQLHAKNLTRTIEDAGTLVNPLIPWGVSGAFFTSVLGVSVIEYIPYAIFLFISPILTIAFGYLGWGIAASEKKVTN